VAAGALITAGFLSSGTAFVAVTGTPSAGPDYSGIALLISAVAALVTAVGGVLLGLRKTSGDEIDRELKKLLAERLKAEEDEQ
jgi:hypothetical protein